MIIIHTAIFCFSMYAALSISLKFSTFPRTRADRSLISCRAAVTADGAVPNGVVLPVPATYFINRIIIDLR